MLKDVKSFLREVKKQYSLPNRPFDEEEVQQLVIPFSHRNIAFSGVPDNVDHPGRDKSLLLAHQRFVCPCMLADFDRRIFLQKLYLKENSCYTELVPIQTS